MQTPGFILLINAHVSALAWLSYLDMSILIGTLALALFNASKDTIAKQFAFAYALISIGVLVCFFKRIRPQTVILIYYVGTGLRMVRLPKTNHHDSQTGSRPLWYAFNNFKTYISPNSFR